MNAKNLISLAVALATVPACIKESTPGEMRPVEIRFETGATKSKNPASEDAVNDVNIFAFNSISGLMESHVYHDSKTYGKEPLTMNLLTNISYDIAACLNFGYRVPDIKTVQDLPAFRFYLVYPDDYSTGMPMSAVSRGFVPGKQDGPLIMKAGRMMAKIGLTIDRSALNKDVSMFIEEAEIGNCPKSMTPFASSKPEGKSDIFSKGFFKKGIPADSLNSNDGNGKSGKVSLYMLESLDSGLQPYIQLRVNYVSPETSAGNGKWLYYRFYIGPREGDTNIKRNTRYHYTVVPHGTGIDGAPSWNVEFTD